MTTDNFVAIKELKKLVVNHKEDTTRRAVNWFSIRWIQVRKEDPLKFRSRRSINELEVWKEVDLHAHQKSEGRPPDIGKFSIPKAYPGPHIP